MINEQYRYLGLTSKVIGCAMTAHKSLGNGFREVIYQRTLAIEMSLAGIAFSRDEMPFLVSFSDHRDYPLPLRQK
jgi:GxxExxY protein